MIFSRICVNNNGDSSSFLDDSEEMMDATKRILLFASLCTKRTLDLNNSIFCRWDAADDAKALPAITKLADLALPLSSVLEM
ncbi:hypothetical protein T4D_11458 [Trichinella pseudospiralis]|uniref:Uncharacterized protein n=1 Tax=Trichinella pseudospiralis TaxID=6337 RepID=A0A0V1FPK4_TRIPS|nr:hypothetical protein T4D_11458 [Trichinella pseudospiralis]